MANKNYQLRFDFNTNDVEIASKSVLSLKTQIQILKKELGSGNLDQQQFEILSKKLNDTKDRFAATDARSRELFGTLSLLPGPVGDISRSLDGAVGLLKTFSSFKLADIKAQFKGLGSDLKDTFEAIGSIAEVSQEASNSNIDLANSSGELAEGVSAVDAASAGQVVQLERSKEATDQSVRATKALTEAQKGNAAAHGLVSGEVAKAGMSQRQYVSDQMKGLDLSQKTQAEKQSLIKGFEAEYQAQQKTTTATNNNTQAQLQNAPAQKNAAGGAALNAAGNEALAVAETKAAVAGRILQGVLISLGIGIAIVLIGQLISSLYNWADGSQEAERQQKELNDELERTNELVELDNAIFKRANAERIANLKANGATEKQIRQQGLKDRYDDYSRAFNDEVVARNLYNNALGKADAETQKKLGDNLTKRTEATKNLLSAYRVAVADARATENKEAQTAAEKTTATNLKNAADDLARRKAELDAKIQLEIDKANTDQKVLEGLLQQRYQLEITGQKKSDAEKELLRNQNTKKVKDALAEDKKVIDDAAADTKKKNEEAVKSTEDFNKKIRDIKTSGILDDVAREKQARTDKYNDDLAALERDKEFIKKSEEEKQQIRADLKVAYNNELNKIDEKQTTKERDAFLKGFDERLRLLELQGQGLLAGTRAYFDNRAAVLAESEAKEMEVLKADLETKKLTQEQYEAAVLAVKEKYATLGNQLEEQKLEAVGKTISATIDAVASLTSALAGSYDEEAKTSEAAFNKRKKLQVATAVMSAASGIVQILTQPSTLPSPFDWIVKGINAVALGIATGVNISKIKATQFEAPESGEKTKAPAPYKVSANRAAGGMVSGAGTSTSDSIPAMISNGEFVVNARATSAYLPLLNAINSAGLQPRFTMGGLASQSSSTDTAQAISTAITAGFNDRPVKTYVVGQDMSTQQQFDRTLKSRSLL